jgi:hypothetical protein
MKSSRIHLVRRLSAAVLLSLASAGTSAALTFTPTLSTLVCVVIPDPIPQGVGGTGGSILASAFRVYGRRTATEIPDIGGLSARRFDYQYIVNNAFITRGRPTFSTNNAAVTSYTGKVIVDTYSFAWKNPSYYTAFYQVSDPLSSMQLDDAFYASQIIGGGIVDAVSYGSAWTIVIKGELANGQIRNVAICSLPLDASMVF